MLRFFLITIFLIYPFDAFSQHNNLMVTYAGWSYHTTSNDRNQDNYIWGVKYKTLEVSTMINSFNDRSYVVAQHTKYYWNDWLDFGLRIGGISGYSKEDNAFQLLGITPIVAPTLDMHYEDIGFEASLFTDVFVFSLNFAF